MVEKSISRKPGRPRKFDTDAILDIVIDVFWELGYEAADTETLSRKTGLTKPSLYNAFGAKEDLFVKALERYQKTRSEASINALVSGETAKEGVERYFQNFASNIASPDHPPGCLVGSIAIPLKGRLPKVAAFLNNPPKESMRKITSFFDLQLKIGNLPKDFDAVAAISLMQDLSAAMILQARAGTPLQALEKKVARYTQLVLFVGKTPCD